MADERAKRDENLQPTQIGIIDDTTATTDKQIKQVRLTKEGFQKVKQSGNLTGLSNDALKTFDENNLLLREILEELKTNNNILKEVHDIK